MTNKLEYKLEVREAYPGSWEWVIWATGPALGCDDEWFEIDHGCDFRTEEEARTAGEAAFQ